MFLDGSLQKIYLKEMRITVSIANRFLFMIYPTEFLTSLQSDIGENFEKIENIAGLIGCFMSIQTEVTFCNELKSLTRISSGGIEGVLIP